MNYLNSCLRIFCLLCAFSCEAKDTKELIHYQTYKPKESIVHVLTVDPTTVKIIAVRAKDVGQGLMTVDNLSRHFAALAGINGGFFRVNEQLPPNGVPAGVLKIANMWHGISYKPRGAIAWQPQTNDVLIDMIQTQSTVMLQDKAWPINAMNKLVTGNKAALLSDSYSDPINVSNTLNLAILDQRIQAIYKSGTINVPSDGYIYSLSGTYVNNVPHLKLGDAAIIDVKVQPQLEKANAKQWHKLPFIVGGGPVLIMRGQKRQDFAAEHLDSDFITRRYARTAIGIMPDKRWVFVVAERSILDDQSGLSIPELRDFMFGLGCVQAVNLDGGGSSAMYISDRKYSSIIEQPVADAILILPKS